MHRTSWIGVVVVALLLSLVGSPLTSQTKKEASSKKSSGVSHAAAENLAAFRADSVHRALEARALAESIQPLADPVADPRQVDTLLAHPLRKITNVAFSVGERLVFNVNYGFITAGEALMTIARYDSVAGRRCFRVEFTVNSLPSFSWVYRVEDRYLTFIDAETIAPWKFEQHVREGSYKRDFVAEFDQVHLVAHTTEGDHKIPQYVHDIMSAFYYARTLDYSTMQPGDILTLYNFYKDTTYELGVKFLGRRDLEVEAGTFKTIVVEPLVKEGGLFKSEGRIVIWLTDDDRKIPVRVNTKVLIGSIDTELREYSGLTGPVQARIK